MKNKKMSAGTSPQGLITAAGKQPLVELSLKALEYVLTKAGKDVATKSMSINTANAYSIGSVAFYVNAEPVNTVVCTDESANEYGQLCLEQCTAAVLPFDAGRKESLEDEMREKVLEYSHDNDMADLVAKNITQTQEHTSFEIVGKSLIDRIKLKEGSGLSVEAALALAGALLSSGVSLGDVTNGLSAFEG